MQKAGFLMTPLIFHFQIAAGMKADLNVELYAIAVGVEGETGVGSIRHDLEIVTETDVLFLPIVANILFIPYCQMDIKMRP